MFCTVRLSVRVCTGAITGWSEGSAEVLVSSCTCPVGMSIGRGCLSGVWWSCRSKIGAWLSFVSIVVNDALSS